MMVGSHVGLAQNRNVKTDPAFTAFWVKFKDAIAKNDKQRVADMTKLPFMMEESIMIELALLKNIQHFSLRR